MPRGEFGSLTITVGTIPGQESSLIRRKEHGGRSRDLQNAPQASTLLSDPMVHE